MTVQVPGKRWQGKRGAVLLLEYGKLWHIIQVEYAVDAPHTIFTNNYSTAETLYNAAINRLRGRKGSPPIGEVTRQKLRNAIYRRQIAYWTAELEKYNDTNDPPREGYYFPTRRASYQDIIARYTARLGE